MCKNVIPQFKSELFHGWALTHKAVVYEVVGSSELITTFDGLNGCIFIKSSLFKERKCVINKGGLLHGVTRFNLFPDKSVKFPSELIKK
jgi:hypothetical protein